MANKVFDGSEAETITIKIRENGNVVEHTFEVLPLNKPRYDAYWGFVKKALPVQQRLQEMEAAGDLPSDDEKRQADELMIAAVEQRLQSTNGPESIRDLWDAGYIPVELLGQIGTYVMEEAGRPPA
jgi:hypothetical protein